jgi:hypothetical protein
MKDQPTVLWQSQNFVAFKAQTMLGHPSSVIVIAVSGIQLNVILYTGFYVKRFRVHPVVLVSDKVYVN